MEALEEERRLAYVAMTRAKEKLFLSFSVGRNNNRRSRFIPEAGIRETKTIKVASSFSNSINISKNISLIAGDKISHSTYGVGEVLEVENDLIKVKFPNEKKIKTLNMYHESVKKWDEANDK